MDKLYLPILNFCRSEFRIKKLNSPFGVAFLLSFSLLISYLIAEKGILSGALVVTGVAGSLVAAISFVHPKTGFTFVFIFSTFLAFITRVLQADLPFGVAKDALLFIVLLGLFFKRIKNRDRINFFVKDPIFIWVLILGVYTMLQLVNPEGTPIGWLTGFRVFLGSFMAYLILYDLFDDFKYIYFFTKMWLVIAIIGAAYGFYQEFFGLPSYDIAWVTASETRIGLNFIMGRWRKWSIFSDVVVFGLMMAFTGIFCIVFALGPVKLKYKLGALLLAGIMLVAMVYSGTRTAYAIVPAGLLLYILMNAHTVRSIVFALVGATLFAVLIYGPFYHPSIIRLRTAFIGSEDASLSVRDENRAMIQPYIHAHPIGGGLVTCGEPGKRFSPGHRLAGFPPDSSYLETALEQGWIGLFIKLLIYYLVMATGVKNYFSAKSPPIRLMYICYLCGFFALTIAAYAQTAVLQVPLAFIIFAIHVIMSKLIQFDESPEVERIFKKFQ